jgi:N-acetylglucosamine-6-phosphate deacetylase
MTMHLEGPWLSTTGKKSGPKKWASAEAKRRAEMLDAMWKEKLKTLGVEQEAKKRKRALKAPALTVKITLPPGRETPYVASQDTGWIACTTAANQEYTGTKVKGIGTMHKSNAVPIFSDEEATDISRMRR